MVSPVCIKRAIIALLENMVLRREALIRPPVRLPSGRYGTDTGDQSYVTVSILVEGLRMVLCRSSTFGDTCRLCNGKW